MSWVHLLRHGDDGGARTAWVDARAQRGATHRRSADAALERESDCKIIVKQLRVQVVASRHHFETQSGASGKLSSLHAGHLGASGLREACSFRLHVAFAEASCILRACDSPQVVRSALATG